MLSKELRKRLGCFCVVAIVACMSAVPVLADVNINVEGTAGKYAAYKVFDLNTQLKNNCGHAGEGAEHSDDCYTYNYTLPSGMRTPVESAATAAGVTLKDADGDGTVSDKEMISSIANMSEDQTRVFADNLYMSLKSSAPTAETTTGRFEGLPEGYYLIAEAEAGESPDSVSLVMLDTASNKDITVSSKEGIPTLTKKILVADETQQDGYKRVDAADINVGDDVDMEVSVTMPDNIKDFGKYNFTLHDDSLGLRLKGDVKMFINGEEVVDNVTAQDTEEDDCLFHKNVTVASLTKADGGEKVQVTKDTVIVFRYTCQLTEDYVTVNTGNTNEAWLDFSSDPYVEGEEDSTVHDKVAVFTYKSVVNKVDADSNPLAGAEFSLMRQEGDSWVPVNMSGTASENQTEFTFSGLDAGVYKLTETKVPDGYTKADDVVFEIRSDYDETSDNPILKGLQIYVNGKLVSEGDNPTFSVDLTQGKVSTDIVNIQGIKMPGTGAVSMYITLACGAVLVIGGCVTMNRLSKKSK